MAKGNVVPSITAAEHIGLDDTGDNIEAKRTAGYVWNESTLNWQRFGVNSEGQTNVVQHGHPNSNTIAFSSGDLTASQDFILIDISDTTNYHHVLTNYVHIEDLVFQTDATSNASYTILLGFLENVDTTNGDLYVVGGVSGSKTTGQSKFENIRVYPNGARCATSYITTSTKSLNDTAFQTDINLASTLNPAVADTPSGNGDLVLRVLITAGTINISTTLPYHTH